MYKVNTDLNKFSYKNIDLVNARVIVRTCLNVSVDSNGKVTDATRLYESLPLIKDLALNTQNVILTAHLGRPEQREQKSSFWNVAEMLNQSLRENNIEVVLVDDLTDEWIDKMTHNINSSESKKVYLLENIRFFKGEESKDKTERMEFAKRLSMLADYFINDAFADYRESASTYDIATLLPSYLGPVFLKEVEALSKFNNVDILVSVLGGAKLSEKLDALNSLAEISEKVVVGGAMAYTLLKAMGINVGKSLIEEDKLDVAKEVIKKYGDKLVLPVDHVVANEFTEEAARSAYNTSDQSIPEDTIAIDIGWRTIKLFEETIVLGNYVLWNGPMGVFEWDKSSKGTLSIGKAIEKNGPAYKLAGGGDSIAAINKLQLKGFNHISTGGGAMLSFLAYEKFPTLDVIINR